MAKNDFDAVPRIYVNKISISSTLSNTTFLCKASYGFLQIKIKSDEQTEYKHFSNMVFQIK